MLKKTKLILASLILSLSCSQSQAGLVGYSLDHPVKTARAVIWAAGITVAAGVVAKAAYLAYHPNEVQSYFKKNPSQIEPISQQVLNKLRNPANRDEYNYYKKLAEQMGLHNIPPYAPIKTNIPTTLVNPITNQDPKGSVLVNPINPDHPEINLDPRDPRTHYDFSKDLPNHTETPIQEPNWQDNILQSESKKLGNNIEKAEKAKDPNWIRPANTEAHHIVPVKNPLAQQARNILEKYFGTPDMKGYNTSENGVLLPNRNNNGATSGIIHNGPHPDSYARAVNKRIVDAEAQNGRQGVLDELEKIKKTLQNSNGKDPWKGVL